MKTKFLIVDYNPDVVNDLEEKGFAVRFGDANDLELLQELDITHTKMVISVMANLDANKLILEQFSTRSKTLRVVTSDDIAGAEELYEAGATYVMMPHYISGLHTSKMLARNGFDLSVFLQQQQKHKQYLLRTKNNA
jgi:voltage-gated potassium channel Kch